MEGGAVGRRIRGGRGEAEKEGKGRMLGANGREKAGMRCSGGETEAR